MQPKMKKIDFKKELGHLYKPSSKEVSIVDVAPMNFLMIDGRGDPDKAIAFKNAIEALFMVSHILKIAIKRSGAGIDYGVMPLEGLWWSNEMNDFNRDQRDNWQWTLMIMQPEYVNAELVAAAVREAERQKNPPALPEIRFDSFFEGPAAQIMHNGLFSGEGPTIEKVHGFIKDNGYVFNGRHHEVYLSDVRRAAPERWRTIVRQPIKKE
jgi:hypothetical protein